MEKSLNNNVKKTPAINLAPPKKETKKKEKTNSNTNSKEFPGSKIDKTRKEIFGVVTIQNTLKRINEQNEKARKERKAQANKKFYRKGGTTKTKKEARKDKEDRNMEVDEENKSIESGNSFLSRKRILRKEDFEEDEVTEAKLKDEEVKILEDRLDLLKYTGDNEKDWMSLIKEAEKRYYDLEVTRVREINSQQQNDFTKKELPLTTTIAIMKEGKAPADDPERRFKWLLDDMNYFFNSKKEVDKEYRDEKVQMKCLMNSMVALMQDLIVQVNTLKQLNIKQLIALKKLGEETVKIKVATDDRILQIEKPVVKWVKEENKEDSPEEKKKREERKKLKQEAKLARIERYKKEKSWIEEEEWNKLSAGNKALHRFVFTDVHQNLTFEQWNTITRDQKNEFIKEKNAYREKRMKEIEELAKENKEKADKARRQFNFFQYRVIDRGIVCDLRGNPFQNSGYRKRY